MTNWLIDLPPSKAWLTNQFFGKQYNISKTTDEKSLKQKLNSGLKFFKDQMVKVAFKKQWKIVKISEVW
jgi:hypothetical protein